MVFSDHMLLLFLHALLNKQRELLTIAKAPAGLCHRLNLTQLHKMNIAQVTHNVSKKKLESKE